MGMILVTASVAVFVWAVVGLIRPTWARLPSRAASVGVWVLSVVLFIIGGALMPDSTPEQTELMPDATPEQTEQSAALGSHLAASGNLTAAQRNAVRSANSYLQLSGFSRQGLIDQLSSEFGDSYSVGDATVAVNSLSTDWNAQAARSAVSYLELSGFSCRGLIDQLSSESGDKYTVEQATYGATQAGIC